MSNEYEKYDPEKMDMTRGWYWLTPEGIQQSARETQDLVQIALDTPMGLSNILFDRKEWRGRSSLMYAVYSSLFNIVDLLYDFKSQSKIDFTEARMQNAENLRQAIKEKGYGPEVIIAGAVFKFFNINVYNMSHPIEHALMIGELDMFLDEVKQVTKTNHEDESDEYQASSLLRTRWEDITSPEGEVKLNFTPVAQAFENSTFLRQLLQMVLNDQDGKRDTSRSRRFYEPLALLLQDLLPIEQ